MYIWKEINWFISFQNDKIIDSKWKWYESVHNFVVSIGGQALLCVKTLRPRQDGRHFDDGIF